MEKSSHAPQGSEIAEDEVICQNDVTKQRLSADVQDKLEPLGAQSPKTEHENAVQFSLFTIKERAWITFLIAFAGMFSPLSSFIYYPAIHSIATNLDVSVQAINLTVTSYMVVSGVVPALLGNFADILGRRPAYIVTFSIYLVANIALALQRSFPALLVLRMLQSAGSSGTIALVYGVIADIVPRERRGFYVGLVLIGPNVAPPFGPVLGGLISDRLGWPYIFWVLCGLSGICLLAIVISLPETARRIVGNGSIQPTGIYSSWLPIRKFQSPATSSTAREDTGVSSRSMPNPLRSLRVIFEKDSAIVLTCNGIYYASYCSLQISLSTLFVDIYDYGETQAGLVYIPFGVGCLVATLLSGKLLDMDYATVARKNNLEEARLQNREDDNFPLEKARLRSVFVWTILSAVMIIGYGWSLEKKVTVAVPLTVQALMGLAITSIFTCLGTLLTDMHPATSSTAAAAANIVRCVLAAVATSTLQLVIDALGAGWCFTLIGLVCSLCTPLLLLERHKGRQWRITYKRRAQGQ